MPNIVRQYVCHVLPAPPKGWLLDGKFIFRGSIHHPFGGAGYIYMVVYIYIYMFRYLSSASIALTELLLLTCFVNNLPNSLLEPKRSTYIWQCVSSLSARPQIKALCVTLSLYINLFCLFLSLPPTHEGPKMLKDTWLQRGLAPVRSCHRWSDRRTP